MKTASPINQPYPDWTRAKRKLCSTRRIIKLATIVMYVDKPLWSVHKTSSYSISIFFFLAITAPLMQ